ncbi:PASTA domain-containing protein [Luteococcus peritonei]
MVAVPAVAGQSEAAATKALKDKGFQVSVVHATPEWLRDDKVKAASPTQGKLAKQGSTVTLWVI